MVGGLLEAGAAAAAAWRWDVVRVLLCSGRCGAEAVSELVRPQRGALVLAARSRDIRAVRALLDAGGDATSCLSTRQTPLAAAAAPGDRAIVDLLLGAGRCGDVGAADFAGRTALMRAASKGHADVIARLLQAGADGEARDKDRSTAPMEAALLQRGNAVRTLLRSGRCGDVNSTNWAERTAPHHAAAVGDVAILTRLLSAGTDPSAADVEGSTSLAEAACRGSTAAVVRLLETGRCMDVDATHWQGRTALHNDASVGSREVARALLAAGADPGIADEDGCTVLMLAAEGRVSLVELLLASGRELRINAGSRRARSDRTIAATGMSSVCNVAALLAAGADTLLRDRSGETTLTSAMHRMNLAAAELFVEHTDDVGSSSRPVDRAMMEASLMSAVSAFKHMPRSEGGLQRKRVVRVVQGLLYREADPRRTLELCRQVGASSLPREAHSLVSRAASKGPDAVCSSDRWHRRRPLVMWGRGLVGCRGAAADLALEPE